MWQELADVMDAYQIMKISFSLFKFIFIHVFWGGAPSSVCNYFLIPATTANNPSNEIFLLWWLHWQQWDYHDFMCPVLLPFNNRHSIQVFLMRCIYKSCHTFFPSQPPCLLPNSNSPTCIRSFEKCRGRKIWEMECILASAHQVWLLA